MYIMLIKKNLKIKQLSPCPIILKLKKQYLPIYPTCIKQKNKQTLIINSLLPTISPILEGSLVDYLPSTFNTKIPTQNQKKKKNLLHFIYLTNLFNFKNKNKIPKIFSTSTHTALLKNLKKESNTFVPFAQSLSSLDKRYQLKIVLKSYTNQLKDLKMSIVMISKLIHYLDSCWIKEFKKLLTNPFYLAYFGYYSSSFVNKIKSFNNFHNFYPVLFSSTFNLLKNFKISKDTLFQKKQKTRIKHIPLNLDLLMKQPLTELLEKSYEYIQRPKQTQSGFLLSILKKTNYCSRYWSSSTFLGSHGPINKQIQKLSKKAQFFTITKSPFVFKKTREQFIKQQVSYHVTVRFHSPIHKELLIKYLTLLRLPVELDIHC